MAQLPPWQPLDGGVPIPDGTGPGRIVAVVASEGAVEAGWAPSAALELARSWSDAGAKVILADGSLNYPALHSVADVDNGEGLSDAALFGASVGRVARPVDGGAFFLIPAGTAVANANSVPASPRWGQLLEGFVEAGVRLLIFVRDGDSGCAAFLGSASDIVVLAANGEKTPAAVRDLEGMVRAVAGPGPGSSVRRSVSAASSVGSAGSGGAGASGTPGLRPPEEWTARASAGRRRVFIMVAAVVVLIALLVYVFSSVELPGLTPEATGTSTTLTAEVPPGVA